MVAEQEDNQKYITVLLDLEDGKTGSDLCVLVSLQNMPKERRWRFQR